MIIRESQDKSIVIYDPEDIKERKLLGDFPGFYQEGLSFYSPNKQNIVYSLYTRLSKKVKNIRLTPYVKNLVEGEMPIKTLPEDFVFHTQPLKHQLIALRFAYTFGSIGLLLEPGLGKTKIVLDFIKLMNFKRSLVICPVALLHVWQDERDQHRPDLSIHIVTTTDWEYEMDFILKAQVVVLNYNKAVIFEEMLASMNYSFIGVDEGLIKDPTTDRTKSITKLGYTASSRMIMSGTLVNNSALDVFSPTRFIEPSLIGRGWTKFKKRYTVTSKKNPGIILGVYDTPEIKSILHACSIIMTKEEWLKDLPKKVFHKRIVQMSDTQRKLYNSLANNYLVVLDDGREVEVNNALTAMCKLYQIANGFLYINPEADVDALEELEFEGVKPKKGKKKPREVLFFDEQPKITELLRITEDEACLKGRRAIIWFNMSAECDIIERALRERGDTFLTIRGGDKELGAKVRQFNKDPNVRWLVCQAKTINYGQTIMGNQEEKELDIGEVCPSFDPKVSDEIFYSMNFSLEMFLQQQDRIHRIGQTRECNYWLILCNCSVEKRTVKSIEEKHVCSKEILEDIVTAAKLDFM
jgi:SNF2 family DNA or RNA helicase